MKIAFADKKSPNEIKQIIREIDTKIGHAQLEGGVNEAVMAKMVGVISGLEIAIKNPSVYPSKAYPEDE